MLESINGITLSRSDIACFGDLVKDFSTQHRDVEMARSYGFLDTPVIGVHIAAIGGRLSRDLMSVLQTPGQQSTYSTQRVTFRDPVYPEEPINWNPPESEVEGDVIRYRLVVPSPDPAKKPRVEMISEFTPTYPASALNLGKLIYSQSITFPPKEVRQYYESLREEPSKSIDFSHGISRIPSILLSLAGELNQIHGTQIGGRNIEMESRAYGELGVGDARIDVHEVDKRGRGNKVFYIFDGVIYQGGKPIISSRVRTLTNGEFPSLYLESSIRAA